MLVGVSCRVFGSVAVGLVHLESQEVKFLKMPFDEDPFDLDLKRILSCDGRGSKIKSTGISATFALKTILAAFSILRTISTSESVQCAVNPGVGMG